MSSSQKKASVAFLYHFLAFNLCVLLHAQERVSFVNAQPQIVPVNEIVVSTVQDATPLQRSPVKLACPAKEMSHRFLPIPCQANSECKFLGKTIICCDQKCIAGVKSRTVTPSTETQTVKLEVKAVIKAPLECPLDLAQHAASNQSNLFKISCTATDNCAFLGVGIICCQRMCVRGVDTAKIAAPAPIRKDVEVLTQVLVCPAENVAPKIISLFNIPCKKHNECKVLGKNLVCCRNVCTKGMIQVKPEPPHAPRFFGLVDAVCPNDRIAEVLEVKLCDQDTDCGGRICCPDKNGKNYCRTPAHRFDRIPGSRSFEEPLRSIASFMQCAPPPPAVIDIFPKPCKNNFDCFPNLCCQESGKKYCRPPKRSILAAIVTRLGTSPVTKSFIERITT